MLLRIAFIANALCLFLLMKHKNTDLNTKSAWICSRNDVMANVGVVITGFLVGYFNSIWPDIIIGLMIAFIVLRSSLSIIKEGINHKREQKLLKV